MVWSVYIFSSTYLKKSRKGGVVVLLKHAVGRVQLLDVSIVGVKVRGKGRVALAPAMVVVGFGVIPAALHGRERKKRNKRLCIMMR